MNCKFPYHNQSDSCLEKSIKNKKFCRNHMYYETIIDINNIKWCDKHTRIPLLNDICSICSKKEEIIKNKILCKGATIKNTPCNFAPLENDEYCKLHQSYKKWKELNDSGKSICCNWIRGCWKENIDNFVKCLECREIDRVKDKKIRNEKKDISIDFNIKNVDHKMCKDCNKVVIKNEWFDVSGARILCMQFTIKI